MKVTGPDGECPITDEQIRSLRPWCIYRNTFEAAIYGEGDERADARAHCAVIWNTRHGDKP